MFATIKTTLGARAQANHEKIGICDHFGKQHNQWLLNGCLWILSTHQSSRLACTHKWFHKSLPRQLVAINLPSWNGDSQVSFAELTLAMKRPLFLWFIDLTLVKILTNGEILHERFLNLTTAALLGMHKDVLRMQIVERLLLTFHWVYSRMELQSKFFVSMKYIANDSNFIISFCLLVTSGTADLSLTLYKKLWGKFLQIFKLFLEVTRKWPIYPFEPYLSVLSSFCSIWWVVSVPDFNQISLHLTTPPPAPTPLP